MCFSAPASFAASAGLGALGIGTMLKNKRQEDLPFAAIPLLLGIQQGVEGVVWLSFGAPAINSLATYLYTIFSHLLWPIFVPIAVMYAEPDPMQKKRLRLFVYLGTFVSLYLLYFLSAEPLSCSVVGQSIRYQLAYVAFPEPMLLLYLVAICGSCFMSSHQTIKLLGLVLFAGFLISFWFYYATFFSVWCFFAAILSAIIFFHVIRSKDSASSVLQAS